jgi:HK97 family phage prohead protease
MTLQVQHVRPRLARTNTPALISALGRDEFEGYASLFNVADGAGDIVAPGAYARSLRRRPPPRVRLLYQHFAHEPIGVWEEIREDPRGLYVRGRLTEDVTRAREVGELIRDGALDGLSIGFRAIRAKRDARTGLRTLLEIELWEISIVTFPLLPGSEVTGIGRKNDFAQQLRRASTCLRAHPCHPGQAVRKHGAEPGPIVTRLDGSRIVSLRSPSGMTNLAQLEK